MFNSGVRVRSDFYRGEVCGRYSSPQTSGGREAGLTDV